MQAIRRSVENAHGRPQEFFPGECNVNILLIAVRLLTMQCKWTFTDRLTRSSRQHHKEYAQCYDNSQKKCGLLSTIARFIAIIIKIGYLQIFKARYLFSQKYCHGRQRNHNLWLYFTKQLELETSGIPSKAINHPFHKILLLFADFFTGNAHHT